MANDTPKLSKLSDYGRSLLAALDEDPQEHQKEVQARLQGKKITKPKEDKVLQALQSGTAKIGPTIAEAAAALEQRAAMWREDAYCIFIAHCYCKNCGARWTGQMDPNVYLRSRKTKKDESNPYMYVPVRSISNWSLPRLRISTFYSLLTCERCFEGLKCLPSSTNSQVSTGSPVVQVATSDGSFASSPAPVPPASTSEAGGETSSAFEEPWEARKLNSATSPSPRLSNVGFPALADALHTLIDIPGSVPQASTPTTQTSTEENDQ